MFNFLGLEKIQGNPLQQYRNRFTSRICFQDDPPENPPVFTADGWKAHLPEEIRRHTEVAKYDDTGDGLLNAVKSLVNVQPLLGLEKIAVPGKDSPKEVIDQAFRKLGWPEKLEEYGYQRPGLPDGFPVNDELEQGLIAKAHELRLTPEQVKGLTNFYYDYVAKDFTTLAEQTETDIAKTEADLKRQWGKAYTQNAALADKVMDKFASDKFKTFLEDSGLGNSPFMAEFLVEIGKALSEDVLVGGPRVTFKTPKEAEAEITRLYSDEDFMKAYDNKNHPGHQMAVDKMYALQQAAHPEE